MLKIRKSTDRGHIQHGWLDTYHTFSFSEYYEPAHMGFSVLRVINEDRIEGGQGFGTHPHRDMEIITYVVEGALEHRDTLQNSSIIRPGDAQRMSAGTGIEHSEKNHSPTKPVHLLQIWILPEANGLNPGYEQKSFEAQIEAKNFTLIASRNRKEGSIHLNQDVDIYSARPKANSLIEYSVREKRNCWIQLVKGEILVNDVHLGVGDGLAAENETKLKIHTKVDSEFLLFDLP